MRPLILVTGATGLQGGAVARHLLDAGFRVRVLTRNPEKPSALRWRERGAEIVRGDQEDGASLVAATTGVDGVYSLQNYWEKGVGYAGEVRQGKALADAARASGVRRFVQASVGLDRADQEDAAPEHFRSKFVVERYARDIGLDVVGLGPVFFYDNFLHAQTGKMTFPAISGTLRADLAFHGVVVDDIGAAARTVFEEPAKFVGTRINLASDSLTVGEMKETWARTLGRKPPRWSVPSFVIKFMNAEFYRQLVWNNDVGWKFSLDETRRVVPTLTSFAAFLERNKAALG